MGNIPTGSPHLQETWAGLLFWNTGAAQGRFRPRSLTLIWALTSMCLSTNQFWNYREKGDEGGVGKS